MPTLLCRFCQEFVAAVRPLLSPLQRAADAVGSAARTNGWGKGTQALLLDQRHQLGLLADKVAEQQAYVLIFGPLKSGKSTLMNAIAAGYVSEVSSLPAYPCMVFVQHAPEWSFSATDYAGHRESFATAEALEQHLSRAHEALATRLRDLEASGEALEPHQHLADAISRIDVRLPAAELGQAKAVLVDTPGLYSRMKIGYGRMTRDFRNAAACAVFVVRTDNLFLEQVFAEFTDLLELFSRIFLVVNVDSTKVDLARDGQLVPSLEQRQPDRIVAAFENLAMSAPLKLAAEEGRLRIYPVDLLRAASARVRGSGDEAAAVAFQQFFTDLTEYLNSTDYLVAFLGDSLRRAANLFREADELCGAGPIRAMRSQLERLERDRAGHLARLQAIARLEEAGLEVELTALRGELAAACRGHAVAAGECAARGLDETIRDWFKSNASLQHLNKGKIDPLLVRYQEELIDASSKELGERLVRAEIGTSLPPAIAADLTAAGIELGAIAREAHQRIDRATLVAVPPTALRAEHFAVRRRFWDWLLLRGAAAVRRRLFGPPDAPGHLIPPAAKASRLGEPARAELRRRLTAYGRDFFADTAGRVVAGFTSGYCELVTGGLRDALRDVRGAAEGALARLTAEIAGGRAVLEPLAALQEQAQRGRSSLERLSAHYASVDLFLLTQPVEPQCAIPAVPAMPAVAVPAADPVTATPDNGGHAALEPANA